MEIDAVLLGEDARERPAADVALVDEDLAEQSPGPLLLAERVLQLLAGQQPFVCQQRPQGTPRETRLVHPCLYRQ